MRFDSKKFRAGLKGATIVVLSIIIGVTFLGGAFYGGYLFGTENPKTIIVKGITNIGDPEARADFGLFWEAWKYLTEKHFDGEKLMPQDVVYGAIAGLTGALKDENTVFFPPEDSKKFEEDISGSFGGIGAEIGIKNEQLVVIAPIKGSPAERVGLRSGDKIVKIDDEFTAGIDVGDAVKIIRGPIGTSVTLTVVRDQSEPKQYKITREQIKIPTIEWSLKDNNSILHLHLLTFNQNAAEDFRSALIKALDEAGEIKGLVLDLRNNPGGFLEVAINIAGWLLKPGDVVTIKESRIEPEETFEARGSGVLSQVPTVVLVNGGSASASEILAGALRDNRHVPIVGEKTFGKGTVQELFPLRDQSKLKITTAHWLTPNRSFINKEGIKATVEVKPVPAEDGTSEKDVQLEKALEVLRGEIKKAASAN